MFNGTYSLDFLIAGLAILIIVFVQLLTYRGDSRFSFKNLTALTACVAVTFVIDFLISTGMVGMGPALLTDASVSLLLIMQCLTIAFFCWHIVELTGGTGTHRTEIVIVAALPLLADIILLISNCYSHSVFTFTPHVSPLSDGPLAGVPFICMGFYALMGAVVSIVRRHSSRNNYVACALLFAFFVIIALIIEAYTPSVRTITFALALGLFILISSELNPFEYVDTLTHAYDITAFRQEICSHHGNNKRYSVIFVAVDRLPELRLLFGPNATEMLLHKCASACRRAGRTRKVYRVRSSVFALLAHSHHEEQYIIENLEAFFEKPHLISGIEVNAYGRIAVIDTATLLANCEQANQYLEFLMDKMRRGETLEKEGMAAVDEFIKYRNLRIHLEKAMEDDLFDVYFQPSWSVRDGKYCSLEALSRLPHPEYGVIPPEEYIPIAEKEGFIKELDRMYFVKVCRFIQEHKQKLEDLGISSIKVNLSPIDLLSEDLGDWLTQTMEEYGVDPKFITFEVTETSATQYDDELSTIVSTLTGLGSSLCMDDFGSGYANIKMILDLPFSIIKLDRSLLTEIETSESASILYSNIVSMLHDLGFRVVAEGAETKRHVELLCSFGVDEIQGFIFAEPTAREDLMRVLGCEGTHA